MSGSHRTWWKQKATWGVTAGGVLALVLWTIPTWGTFWSHVAQFPVLWQIPDNRRSIVSLCIKMLAPVLMMTLGAGLVWLATQIRALELTRASEPVPQRSAHPTRTASLPGTAPRPMLPLPPSQARGLPQAAPGKHDPLTPLALRPPLAEEDAPEEKRPAVIRPDDETPLADAPIIVMNFLKDVTMAICVPGGKRVVVPLTLNAKRVQLLAYIAWRRGELIDRDKILEHVFGHGLRDEDATEEKLSERFESHKKLLRRRIRDVVAQINRRAGTQVIDPTIDLFTSDGGFWGLASICRVDDLEEMERLSAVIATAREEGTVDGNEIPASVKEACDALLKAYTGDFLEAPLKKHPGEFKSWGGRSSWARKPYTQYRDYYLDALWYSAQYEWRVGQRFGADVEKAIHAGDEQQQQHARRRQHACFIRAAQYYRRYAIYACNSRFDAKATFGAHGEVGERIEMSERALRRCVVLLGAVGRTDLVDQVWNGYRVQMKRLSDQRWQPRPETLADVEAARAQTSAYRFSAQVSEFADRQGHAS